MVFLVSLDEAWKICDLNISRRIGRLKLLQRQWTNIPRQLTIPMLRNFRQPLWRCWFLRPLLNHCLNFQAWSHESTRTHSLDCFGWAFDSQSSTVSSSLQSQSRPLCPRFLHSRLWWMLTYRFRKACWSQSLRLRVYGVRNQFVHCCIQFPYTCQGKHWQFLGIVRKTSRGIWRRGTWQSRNHRRRC